MLRTLQRRQGNAFVQRAVVQGRSATGVSDHVVKQAQSDQSSGQSLDSSVQTDMEAHFGRDFSGVRIHKDGRAADLAENIHAQAFTMGQDIYFGAGRYQPGAAQGKHLLAHELTHTIQQQEARSRIQTSTAISQPTDRDELEADSVSRQMEKGLSPQLDYPNQVTPRIARKADTDPAPPPGYTIGPDPDHPLVPTSTPAQSNDEGLSTTHSRDFPIQTVKFNSSVGVLGSDPSVFQVPIEATRSDIAFRLFGDEIRMRDFDGVTAEQATGIQPGNQGVRPRRSNQLVEEASNVLHKSLDEALNEDVKWVLATLSQRRIDDDDERNLVHHTAWWAQKSGLKDASGIQYFDKYLNQLDATKLTEHRWPFSDITKTGLEWLLIEAEERATLIYELIALRSTRGIPTSAVTGEKLEYLERKKGELPPDSTVGKSVVKAHPDRIGFKGETNTWPIQVKNTLIVETTLAGAEIATRNSSERGPRVVIPGGDGKFYGYKVNIPFFEEDYQPTEDGARLLNYWWIYPDTIFIKGGEFQADFPKGGEPEKQQRNQLLADALARATTADVTPLLGLDFDVLSLATLDQRMTILRLAVNSPKANETQVPDLITRLIYATPNNDFSMLERRMSTEGITHLLIELNKGTNILAMIGRVFTAKTLATMPIGAEAITGIETFKLGKDEEGRFHYAMSEGVQVQSKVVPTGNWSPESSPRIGNEPGVQGETGGSLTRTGIQFYAGSIKITGHRPEARTRLFLPTELVRIQVLDPTPQTMIVTALEAAGLLEINSGMLFNALIRPYITVYQIAFAATGLLRVFGSAVAEGLLQGGLRGAVAAAGEVAATKAGTAAILDALFMGSMIAVDAYRDELQKTEAGREFLAFYDVAMTVLIAHDVYRLATGIGPQLGKLAVAAWESASDAARKVLMRVQDEIEALKLTIERLRKEGQLVLQEAEAGGRIWVPANLEKARLYLMEARAHVAGQGLIRTLEKAGRSTTVAKSVMEALEKISANNAEMAQAHRAVARYAADLKPAAMEAYLKAVEQLLSTRPGANASLHGFLLGSTRSTDALRFLENAQWLVSRKQVAAEALEQLGVKAARGSAGLGTLDLEWLRTISLTDAQLSFMGKDSNTPWDLFRRVVSGDSSKNSAIWTNISLRGIGAEFAMQRNMKEILPGYRIIGRQVKMGGREIDYEVMSNLGSKHGLEVKGLTPDRWEDALAAYKARAQRVLSAGEERDVELVDRMIQQLQEAKAARKGHPFLSITGDISAKDEKILRSLLQQEVPGTEIVKISEADIQEASRSLRAGLGIE